MTDVASRELRNNTRALLDRVEAGEDLRITVDGRPVAILVSANRRPTAMPRSRFARLLADHQADPALRDELRHLTPDTTDDLA
jgi:prevent-host-death family protein